MRQKHKTAIIILISIVLVSFIAFILSLDTLFNVDEETKKASDMQKKSLVYFDDKPYKPKKTVNYLLVGIDNEGELKESGTYLNTSLNDFVVLVSFNLTDKTFFILPINRDTICRVYSIGLTGKILGYTETQLAYAHTEGNGLKESFRNTKRSVSELLFNLDIERFVGCNMTAVPIVNDYVGGITLTLEEDLTPINEEWTQGATITLMGDDSIKFVRARREVSDGTNVSRMARQKQYVNALIKKIRENDYSQAEILSLVEKYICHNMVNADFIELKSYLQTYTYIGTKEIEGTTRINNELMEFIPDQEKLKQLVIELFYNEA